MTPAGRHQQTLWSCCLAGKCGCIVEEPCDGDDDDDGDEDDDVSPSILEHLI
jgi:hypothetical protein